VPINPYLDKAAGLLIQHAPKEWDRLIYIAKILDDSALEIMFDYELNGTANWFQINNSARAACFNDISQHKPVDAGQMLKGTADLGARVLRMTIENSDPKRLSALFDVFDRAIVQDREGRPVTETQIQILRNRLVAKSE